MNFKNILLSATNIIFNRIIQIIGIVIIIFGFLFFLSLVTYSPDDPNFIFPENEEIKNLLGFKGSLVSDFCFQAIGLISFLIPLSIVITGINLILNKKFWLYSKICFL